MARNVKIPIAFEWYPRRASWTLLAAQITGWASFQSRQTEPCFRAKVVKGGSDYLVDIPLWDLPQTALKPYLENSSQLPGIRGLQTELLVFSPGVEKSVTGRSREANPWTMRQEFLRLKPNTKALLVFLNKWGAWGATRTALPSPPEVNISPASPRRPLGDPIVDFDAAKVPNIFASGSGRPALTYVLPSDIWKFQELCRKAITDPAREWLPDWVAGGEKWSVLNRRTQYPHFSWTASNCEAAIRTTITIDNLNKVKSRICARPDCRTPYTIETRHQRKYCGQYCAHIESVRRQRRAAKRRFQNLLKGVTHAKRQTTR